MNEIIMKPLVFAMVLYCFCDVVFKPSVVFVMLYLSLVLYL